MGCGRHGLYILYDDVRCGCGLFHEKRGAERKGAESLFRLCRRRYDSRKRVEALLIPAINEAEALGRIGWIPAAGGFALGVLFLMGLDKAMPYFLPEPEREEGVRRGLKRSGMLILRYHTAQYPGGHGSRSCLCTGGT